MPALPVPILVDSLLYRKKSPQMPFWPAACYGAYLVGRQDILYASHALHPNRQLTQCMCKSIKNFPP